MTKHDCREALREILSRARLESREIVADEINEKFAMLEVTDCMPYVVTVSLSDGTPDDEKLRGYSMSLMICTDMTMVVFALSDKLTKFNDTQLDALSYLTGTYLSQMSSPTSYGKMVNDMLSKHPRWSSFKHFSALLSGLVLKSKPFSSVTGRAVDDSDEDDTDILKDSVYFQS
jgi:hypothetical protein